MQTIKRPARVETVRALMDLLSEPSPRRMGDLQAFWLLDGEVAGRLLARELWVVPDERRALVVRFLEQLARAVCLGTWSLPD